MNFRRIGFQLAKIFQENRLGLPNSMATPPAKKIKNIKNIKNTQYWEQPEKVVDQHDNNNNTNNNTRANYAHGF